MSIRLNKALGELNVGVQTAVEFLSKKNLGDVKADPNTKISDEQYNALVSEFKNDKDLRSQAEKLIHVHTKDKNNDRAKKDNKAEAVLQNNRQEYKPIGKIDLDNTGKNNSNKPSAASEVKNVQETKAQSAVNHAPEVQKTENQSVSAPTAEAKPAQPVQQPKPEQKPAPTQPSAQAQPKSAQTEQKQQVTVQNNPAQQAKPVSQVPPQHPQQNGQQPKPSQTNQVQKVNAANPQNQQKGNGPQHAAPTQNGNHQQFQQKQPQNGQLNKPAQQQQNKPQQPVAQSSAPQPTAPATREEPHIFTLKSETKLAPKVNVLGKIDLDSLNQSTRPKKKTKEERRKEREEKNHQNNTVNGERKKRVRINKERVDVNAAVNQGGGNNNNNNRNRNNNGNNNNGNNNNNNSGSSRRNRRRNQQVNKPLEVNEEDVAKQVKETLARLTSKTQNQNKKGAKYRKEKREAVQERMAEVRQEEKAESKIIKLTEFVTANELATMMNVPVNKVIATCMSIGIMVSINQRLDAETINLVADEFGFKTEYVSAEVAEAISEEDDDEEDLLPRAPIVTVMGHVDHGKTSLLDYIRKANVIAGEAGGITQHIGAYNVKLESGRRITFLDTPGHEAFTAMRARGTQVTDIAIIIIAADDSVMPTTKEAIAHAQAANVPMVFAINKIDKPGANPDKIREDLANMNLLVEEWGGKYQCQEISAKKGIGVKELLEKVLLEADILDRSEE